MLNSEELNKLFLAAINGKTLKEIGLTTQEHIDAYGKIVDELAAAPKGSMPMPVNDWIGDEYDDMIAHIEACDARDAAAMSKSLGSYRVSKAEGEKRYTLGAMYIPDRIDAHGEWTDSDELQRAVWDYVKSNDRRIRLQHNRDVVAGEWVEVMAFPYELTVPIQTMTGVDVNHTYPANTVFLGVIWEPWAWDMVKEGKILGYSIGGKAERLYVDMEDVEKEDGPGVSDVHVDTIMNPKKKKPKDK